jgi:uncharacterized protein
MTFFKTAARFNLAAAAVCVFAAAAFTNAPFVSAEDAPAAPVVAAVNPEALAAAKDLMVVTGAAKNFDNMVGMMKTHVTASAGQGPDAKAIADSFDKAMTKIASYKQQMMDEMAALHAAKFSADELKAVTEFYKSGPGAKFVTLMPELMQEGGAIGQKYAVQMMKDFKDAKEAK